MIRYFAAHPTAANLLMLAILVLGLASFADIRRESLPDTTPTELEIRVAYPGATATEVEESVVGVVEDAIDGVRYVDEVRSEALEGVGTVTVEMVENGDFDTFFADINSEVDAIDNLPKDADEPIVTQLNTKEPVVSILVQGPMTEQDLKAYCEDFKDRLQRQPQVSLVSIEGFADRQLRVNLSAEALMRYGLSSEDINQLIATQSINTPVGGLETMERDLTLRFIEERRSPAELEDLTVKATQGGAEVRLGDIAHVTDTFELPEEKILLEGQRACKIVIEKTKTEDALKVNAAVLEFLEVERQRQPPTIRFVIVEDETRSLRDRLQLVLTNGLQGMVLVFLMMWLFFQLRLSFWVVMGLPVSFLGAAIFMPTLGLTINIMTLVGFLLALGILMDDAIVVAENIASHIQRGKSTLSAVVDGVNEVKSGVFSSFLTTVCVLGPLAFIAGDIGKLLEVVPMILILVLIVSLVEVFLILPAHLNHSLHGFDPAVQSNFRRRFETMIEYVRERWVGRSVEWIIARRYAFSGVMLGLLLVAAATLVSGHLPFQALPPLEGDTVVARVLMPQGTPLARTEAVVEQLLSGLKTMDEAWTPRQPSGESLVRNASTQFNRNDDAYEQGPHVATISVDLLTAEARTGRIDDYTRAWREAAGTIPDALSITFSEPSPGPEGRAIEVRLAGRDLERLKVVALELKDWFAQFNGVKNLSDDLRPGKPELRLRVRPGVLGQGLTVDEIARQLSAAFQGVTATELQIGDESYETDVRFHPSDQDSRYDLAAFRFILSDGAQIPLTALIEIEEARSWARIARVNGMRTVTLRGDVETERTNSNQLIQLAKREIVPKLTTRYPGITITFEGQVKNTAITQGSIISGMLFGLIGVFILLSIQFRSYIEPLAVMLIIPLALIGVVGGHLLLGMPFTLPSLLGFVSLAGIVVNDSILLVQFTKVHVEAGEDTHRAAALASRARFRAILLTSTSTIVGLLPLLAETSLQAQIIQPLAISIAFGLMMTTVLVLYVVPCFYVILDDFGVVKVGAMTEH